MNTPHLAFESLQQWLSNHQLVDPFRLTEMATGRGGLPLGPFEELTGERVTPVQILARLWETLDGPRPGSTGQWLLDLYPDTQTDPASLGELLAASSRPISGLSSDENNTIAEEQRRGLDELVVRCEKLLEALPRRLQEQAHQAMIASTHRSFQHALKAGRSQALRRWTTTLSNWFTGPIGDIGPQMPGYFSWEQPQGSPFSKEAARLLHVVFQLTDDDVLMGRTFRPLLDGACLLSPAVNLAPHGLEALREAWEDMARHMLDGLLPLNEATPYPSAQAFRALIGINAVLVLLESGTPEANDTLRTTLKDEWPIFETHVHQLPVYQRNGIDLNGSKESALFAQLMARSSLALKQIRAWEIGQALPEAARSAPKPRF